jgi:hypothetical protein
MSVPISVALIRTPLTANQLSIGLVAVGFYSAWLFSLGHYWAGILGAFISLAASVLDGSDGEIARLKYQESALCCWIETFGDYSYYLAVFVGARRRTAAGRGARRDRGERLLDFTGPQAEASARWRRGRGSHRVRSWPG